MSWKHPILQVLSHSWVFWVNYANHDFHFICRADSNSICIVVRHYAANNARKMESKKNASFECILNQSVTFWQTQFHNIAF